MYDETAIEIIIPKSNIQGEVPIFLSKNLPRSARITNGTAIEYPSDQANDNADQEFSWLLFLSSIFI